MLSFTFWFLETYLDEASSDHGNRLVAFGLCAIATLIEMRVVGDGMCTNEPPTTTALYVLRCHYFTLGLRFVVLAAWYDSEAQSPRNQWFWFDSDSMPLDRWPTLACGVAIMASPPHTHTHTHTAPPPPPPYYLCRAPCAPPRSTPPAARIGNWGSGAGSGPMRRHAQRGAHSLCACFCRPGPATAHRRSSVS